MEENQRGKLFKCRWKEKNLGEGDKFIMNKNYKNYTIVKHLVSFLIKSM